MTDFLHVERTKLLLATAGVVLAYIVTMLLLRSRLGPSATLASETLVLGLTAGFLMVASWLLIYTGSFRGKGPCVDCQAQGRRRFTRSQTLAHDEALIHVCPAHQTVRHRQHVLERLRAAAEVEGHVPCPYCRQPMAKSIQEVKIGHHIIYVISDDCEPHGRFNSWEELRIFGLWAARHGLDHASHKGRARILAGKTLLANTVPLAVLEEHEEQSRG